jgi:hypothetical protein
MRNLKASLLKYASTHPELTPHINHIVKALDSKTERTAASKIPKLTPAQIKACEEAGFYMRQYYDNLKALEEAEANMAMVMQAVKKDMPAYWRGMAHVVKPIFKKGAKDLKEGGDEDEFSFSVKPVPNIQHLIKWATRRGGEFLKMPVFACQKGIMLLEKDGSFYEILTLDALPGAQGGNTSLLLGLDAVTETDLMKGFEDLNKSYEPLYKVMVLLAKNILKRVKAAHKISYETRLQGLEDIKNGKTPK